MSLLILHGQRIAAAREEELYAVLMMACESFDRGRNAADSRASPGAPGVADEMEFVRSIPPAPKIVPLPGAPLRQLCWEPILQAAASAEFDARLARAVAAHLEDFARVLQGKALTTQADLKPGGDLHRATWLRQKRESEPCLFKPDGHLFAQGERRLRDERQQHYARAEMRLEIAAECLALANRVQAAAGSSPPARHRSSALKIETPPDQTNGLLQT